MIRHIIPLGLLCLAGCRGQPSEKQPLHLVGDMDWQPKLQAQEASSLFEDGRGMRPLVPGTVAQGHLAEDDAFHRGMVDGKHVARAPVKVDEALLRRGQDRFNIYCTPCHDKTGSGRGLVIQRGYPPPVDLSSDRVLTMPDGQIYDTITNGVRNMPAYRKQIPVEDRWAITAWVRVLQHSQHGKVDDVPAAEKGNILPSEDSAADTGAKGAK
ncbi:MAG TPA: cytochrome c [Candidatus Nanopelagicales bacterium]|nr:cytochrome c [Candidatus Nanopelagicales bacterium]